MKKLLFLFISILLSFCSINPVNAQFGPQMPGTDNENVPSKKIKPGTKKENMPERIFDNYCESRYNFNPIVTFKDYEDRLEWTCQDEIFTNIMFSEGSYIYPVEGCTDQTAINYNPQANVHKESMCEYTPPYTPQDISGAFQKSQVSIGATTWTIRVNLNVPNANLDPSVIQTWNRFKAVSATTNEKTLEIVMRQFDDQRLEIEECTSYELTIPRNALYTTEGDTNANPISGNFEVIGCPEKIPDPVDTGTGTTQTKHENTIKEDNFYLSLYDTDENGKVYLNLTNIIYFVGFLSFFSVLFFVLFGFIKNSFLGKSKKSSR